MIAHTSILRAVAVVAVLGLTLTACDSGGGSNNNPNDVAPTLISSAAFDYDGDSFASTFAPPGEDEVSSFQGTNHTRAFATVFLVNTAVGIHLILPSALTSSAGQDTPHVENGTWIWENTTTILGRVIDMRLEGTAEGSSVDWRMYMSADNWGGQAYDDFLLYTATTQIGGQSGSWSLYYDIEDQGRTRVLDADYERSGSLHQLVFSIPETNPNEEARGDSVTYEADGSDRFFDHDVSGGNRVIEWDAVTKAGSITAFDYNGGEQACWDSNLDNVACTPTL